MSVTSRLRFKCTFTSIELHTRTVSFTACALSPHSKYRVNCEVYIHHTHSQFVFSLSLCTSTSSHVRRTYTQKQYCLHATTLITRCVALTLSNIVHASGSFHSCVLLCSVGVCVFHSNAFIDKIKVVLCLILKLHAYASCLDFSTFKRI